VLRTYQRATIEEEAFYDLLEVTLHHVKQSDIVILLDDLNAKIGETIWVLRMLWADMVWAPEIKMEICLSTYVWTTIWWLAVAYFRIKIYKATSVAPNQRTFNQIDHIAISKKWRSLLDVRSYRWADVASDHPIVVPQLRLKLAANTLSGQRVMWKKFNIDKFNHGETRKSSRRNSKRA